VPTQLLPIHRSILKLHSLLALQAQISSFARPRRTEARSTWTALHCPSYEAKPDQLSDSRAACPKHCKHISHTMGSLLYGSRAAWWIPTSTCQREVPRWSG